MATRKAQQTRRGYVILRHGSNQANQDGALVQALGTREAMSEQEAIDRFTAERPDVTVYNNQYLTAVTVGRAPRRLLQDAQQEDGLVATYGIPAQHLRS